MNKDDNKLLQKIRLHRETIIKNGTYVIDTSDTTSDSYEEEFVSSPYDVVMPPRTEDFIQNNIDAMISEYGENNSSPIPPSTTAEEDEKIAEILGKFASNIQDNVSDLFDKMS